MVIPKKGLVFFVFRTTKKLRALQFQFLSQEEEVVQETQKKLYAKAVYSQVPLGILITNMLSLFSVIH